MDLLLNGFLRLNWLERKAFLELRHDDNFSSYFIQFPLRSSDQGMFSSSCFFLDLRLACRLMIYLDSKVYLMLIYFIFIWYCFAQLAILKRSLGKSSLIWEGKQIYWSQAQAIFYAFYKQILLHFSTVFLVYQILPNNLLLSYYKACFMASKCWLWGQFSMFLDRMLMIAVRSLRRYSQIRKALQQCSMNQNRLGKVSFLLDLHLPVFMGLDPPWHLTSVFKRTTCIGGTWTCPPMLSLGWANLTDHRCTLSMIEFSLAIV